MRKLDPTFGWQLSAGPHRHRSCPVVDQISQQPVDQKYLGRANTLLWYVRSSEGLAFGLKPASITDLYHDEAFRVSKIMNFQGYDPTLEDPEYRRCASQPKIAPLMHEMQCHREIEAILVHTGQDYDENLSDILSDRWAFH